MLIHRDEPNGDGQVSRPQTEEGAGAGFGPKHLIHVAFQAPPTWSARPALALPLRPRRPPWPARLAAGHRTSVSVASFGSEKLGFGNWNVGRARLFISLKYHNIIDTVFIHVYKQLLT